MIKKIFGGAVIAAIILGTFGIGQASVASAQEKSLTNAQLIETLISLGIIPADKAAAARAVIAPVTQPPVATTTASAKLVSAPTIELLYDSKGSLKSRSAQESLLSAKANVVVAAGNKGDLKVLADFNTISFMDGKNAQIGVNSYRIKTVSVTRGVKEDSDSYGRRYFVIPAGKSVELTMTATVDPKALFAGVYYAMISSVAYTNGEASGPSTELLQVAVAKGVSSKSASKTVVGEVSPYITGVTASASAGQEVVIKGVRLKGGIILIDDSVPSGVAYKDGDGTSLRFNLPSGISAGTHSVSVRNSTTGDSNRAWFVVKGDSVEPIGQSALKVLSPNGGEAIDLNGSFAVSFTPNVGETHSINLVDVTKDVAYDLNYAAGISGGVVGASTDKQSITVDGKKLSQFSIVPGDNFKIEVCVRNGCDKSDGYVTVKNSAKPDLSLPVTRAEFSSLGAPSISQSSSSVGSTSTTTIVARFNVLAKAVDGDVSFEKQNLAPFTFVVYRNGVKTDLSAYSSSVIFETPSSGVTTSVATSSLLFTLQKNNEVAIPVMVSFIPSGSEASYSVSLEKIRYVALPGLQYQTAAFELNPSSRLWSTGTLLASGFSGAGAAFLSLQGIVNWVTSLVK